MKLIVFLLAALALFQSCQKSSSGQMTNEQSLTQDESLSASSTANEASGKLVVCHLAENKGYEVIEISQNALKAHLAHGDKLSPFPKELYGTWNGSAIQVGAGSWTISLTIDCESVSVAYPSLGCVGYWELLDTDNNTFHFREIITVFGRCVSPCGVTITLLADGTLSFDVVSSECYDGQAHGTLSKN